MNEERSKPKAQRHRGVTRRRASCQHFCVMADRYVFADEAGNFDFSADSDPCIQVADYANWAIQRRWEQGDPSAHKQIGHLIRSEYDAWP
jgi:hypothetical protein